MKNRLVPAPALLWRAACLVACLFLAAMGAALAAPVGSVIDVSGEVALLRDGGRSRLGLFDNLFAGDRLRLPGGTRLVLTHNATRSEYSLSAPAEAELTAEGVNMRSGAPPKVRLLSELAALALGGVAGGQAGGRAVVGAAQMRGVSQPPTTPSHGDTILDTTPLLSWQAVSGVDEYKLVLKNADGETLLETRTARTSWPVDPARPLAWGATYDWTLSARQGERPFELFRTFKVIGQAERAALSRLEPKDADAFADGVIHARALEYFGAYAQARAVWRRLADARPDLPELRALAQGKAMPVSHE